MSNVFNRPNQIVSQYSHEMEIMASNSIPFPPKKFSAHNARYFPQIARMIGIMAPSTPYSLHPKKLARIMRARPVLFSTSHSPSVVATCIAAIDLLESDTSLVERLWENTHYFKRGLEQLGFNTGHSETPITPVIVGEAALAMKFSTRLFEEGLFAQGIVFPTVPADKCRVRTIVTALHTHEELTRALDIFQKVGKELNII